MIVIVVISLVTSILTVAPRENIKVEKETTKSRIMGKNNYIPPDVNKVKIKSQLQQIYDKIEKEEFTLKEIKEE